MATFEEDWAKLKATTEQSRVIPLVNHDPKTATRLPPEEAEKLLTAIASWSDEPMIKKKYSVDQINEAIKHVDSNQISDGFHTFKELYDHRIELWIALCRVRGELAYHQLDRYGFKELHEVTPVWRSEYHSDGEKAFGGGWFVLGIGKHSAAQLTYHLPMSYWDQCSFAQTLDKAPEWDGHSASDVLERLKTL